MKSSKARKQRKAFFNAPLHQRRKQIGAHLEENLLLKYDKRQIPVVVGDTVKVMRGAFKGHENKVSSVHLKKHLVEVEGVTITKADGKQVAKAVHPSNLLITKLNLTDKWRRQRLEEGLSTETKKEIEQEATDQIKQLEQERKEEEERRKREEEEAAQEEEIEEEPVEEETPEPEEPSEPKQESKKPESKKEKKPTKKEDVTEEKKQPVKKQPQKPKSSTKSNKKESADTSKNKKTSEKTKKAPEEKEQSDEEEEEKK